MTIQFDTTFDASMGYPGLNPVSREAWGTTGLQNNESSGSAFFSDLFKQVIDRTQAAEQDQAAYSLNARLSLALSQNMMMQINESLLGILTEDGDDQPLCDPFMDGFGQMLFNQAAGRENLSEIRQAPSENGFQEIEANETVTATTEETKRTDSLDIEGIIQKAAKTFGVNSGLIKAVIDAESSFNPDAVSPKGAMGLMQLMPDTAKELGVKDPLNPTENVMGGTRYLKQLLDRYDGSAPLALAAYNWGMGNLDSRQSQMPTETKNYVAKITGITLT
ncbi:lytic transglycosylase domain-containing protein [Desulfobacter sp.]|uniref:lytic transglycosylase domain-containing protein n=1 Tax=Desulfobacter sp. TaxID=2294 RepID=UPI003D10A11D